MAKKSRARKSIKKPRKVFDSIYLTNRWYMVGWSSQEYEKFVLDNFGYRLNSLEHVTGQHLIAENNGIVVHVIWIRDKNSIATIAHEALHCAISILEDRGVKYGKDNDESLCYLLGQIVNEVLDVKMSEYIA